MPPAIMGGALAAAGSIAGGLMSGGGGGDAARQAAAIQAQAAQQAAQLKYQMFQQAREDVSPWLKAGQATVPQLGGLYSLPGYAPVDPTQTLQATPGYQWLLGQGTNARDLSAASKGLALSGAQQKGLTNWGQNLAQTYAWNPYINQLYQIRIDMQQIIINNPPKSNQLRGDCHGPTESGN